MHGITNYFHIPKVTKDAVILQIFLITFKGKAKEWIKSILIILVMKWEELNKSFIHHYIPPSKVARLKTNIDNVQQQDGKTLFKAWDCYKDLFCNFPQHELNARQRVIKFYGGISIYTR